MKKAVLIAASNDYTADMFYFTPLFAPPLGVLALGSYLAARGIPVELIDVQMDFGIGLTRDAERIVCRRVAQYLCDQADDIAWVGISQLSNVGTGVVQAQEIRAALPDVPIVLGGYSPSAIYRTLLKRCPFITAIVRSDGEAAALSISRSLDQGRSFLSEQTPNLAWRDGDEIRANPLQPMAMGDLPVMDFRLLRNLSGYQIIGLVTARGCPFQCNYCLEESMRPYAASSPDWFARQLDCLPHELPNRTFIYDPIFGVGRNRTLEMCLEMGQYRRFSCAAESRVDTLTPDLIPVLRQAGIEAIFWGIESASTATLLRMNKVRSLAQAEKYIGRARKLLEACFENDVTPFIGLMLGYPGDTEDDCRATLEFVEEMAAQHDQTTEEPGLVPITFTTKVYDGSTLAEQLDTGTLTATLRHEPFFGEKTVLSPSAGLSYEVVQQYQDEVMYESRSTCRALERARNFFNFSLGEFLEAQPGLESRGVVVFEDLLSVVIDRTRKVW